MSDETRNDSHAQPPQSDRKQDSLLARHPRLGILLIAGIFYLILFGMVMTVLVLILRG